MRGPNLPGKVVLPTLPILSAGELQAALGASRQVLYQWRKRYAFPPSRRRGPVATTSTNEIAAWLGAHGVTIKWI